MQYDAALKELLRAPATSFFNMLVGSSPVEWLNVELPSVQMRIPDLVARLADGRIHHLELQSSNDPDMAWRMLNYYQALRLKIPSHPIIHQQVLYVGPRPVTLPSKIEEGPLSFHYQVVDIRQFDAQPLLDSRSPEDNLLAILCRTKDAGGLIRRIIANWTDAPESQRADLAVKLLLLSGLRDLEGLVRKEIKQMPITLDLLETNSVIRELVEERVEEKVRGAESRLVRALLQRRFGQIPDWAEQRLQTADPATLERWAVRLLDAPNLEDALS